MIKEGHEPRRVFIIGAGMSAECGAPTVNGFLKDEFTQFTERRRQMSDVKDFIRRVYPAGSHPNIEEVMSLIDVAIGRNERLGGYKTKRIKEIRSKILYLISSILNNFQYDDQCALRGKKINCRDNRDVGHFREYYDIYIFFLQNLKERDAVISFNYDLFIEQVIDEFFASEEIRLPEINYCGMRRLMDDLLPRRVNPKGYFWRRKIKEAPDDCSGVRFLKLHGSLNWIFCKNCGTIYELALPFTHSHIQIAMRKAQSWSIPEKRKNNCCKNFSPELLIVPPTWAKGDTNHFINRIWNLAENELVAADELVFLGYSFAESDYRFRHLLNKAYANRKKEWQRVIVADISVERVKDRYIRFFGPVEFFEGKVSDFLKILFK